MFVHRHHDGCNGECSTCSKRHGRQLLFRLRRNAYCFGGYHLRVVAISSIFFFCGGCRYGKRYSYYYLYSYRHYIGLQRNRYRGSYR